MKLLAEKVLIIIAIQKQTPWARPLKKISIGIFEHEVMVTEYLKNEQRGEECSFTPLFFPLLGPLTQ